jgi:periplasmic protein TonB
MEQELDLEKATFDQIIFEDRNKSYGAYFLRILYEKNVNLAVVATCIAFAVLTFGVNFYYRLTAMPTEVYVPMEISMEVSEEPLKKEELEKLPPPPPKIEQPKIEEVKYLPPVIKPDKSVKKEEQMKELDSLLNTNISNRNVEGDKKKKVDWDEGLEGGEIGGTGEKQAEVFTYVGEMPKFRGGGDEEVIKYVQNKLVYPADALAQKLQGTVYVQYTITSKGDVTDVQIVKGKGLSKSIDAEAINVIKNLPKWEPGKNNGVPVSVKKVARIQFSIPK